MLQYYTILTQFSHYNFKMTLTREETVHCLELAHTKVNSHEGATVIVPCCLTSQTLSYLHMFLISDDDWQGLYQG